MSLWGNTTPVLLTGNVTIAAANTTLHGLAGATFTTELTVGQLIDCEGQTWKIASITDANTAELTAVSGDAVTNKEATLAKDPKWLSVSEAALVQSVNTETAQARTDGIKTPGWTRYEEYGTGRKRVEILVAQKGN